MNRKSVWALAAGLIFIVGVTTLVDIVLHLVGVYPPMDQPMNNSLALLATVYRIVISIAGAWLTARLAPDRPLKHAMVLGYIGVALGLVGLAATWNMGLGPRWYPIALVVLAIPQCWVGGKIFEIASGRRQMLAS